MRGPARALVLVLVLGGLAPPARAGGFAMATFGGRRGGMIATVGNPDDPTAVFHNPAGLADQPGVHLYLFLAPGFLDPQFRLQALDSARFPEIDPARWPVDSEGYYRRVMKPEKVFGIQPFLAVQTDLGFLSRRGRDVVVSLAVYAPNIYAAYLPEDAPTAYHIIGGMFVVGATTLGVGWKINRYVSVGANLSYNLMYLSMAQKISLIDALSPAGGPLDNTAVSVWQVFGVNDLRLDFAGMDHGVGWSASVLVKPTDWLSIGLAYNGATPARFEGDLQFELLGEPARENPALLGSLLGFAGFKLPKRMILQMPIPHSLSVGAHFRINWHLELGVEARFWFYQVYKRQTLTPIYDPAEEGEEPFSEDDLSRDKKYRLSYQVTGGVMVRVSRRAPGLELMLGTGYDQSPIPDETFTLDNPSLSHWKIAAGVRWRINAHWRVSLTYYLNVFVPRDITTSETSPPTNCQGKGFSHSPGLEMQYTF